MQLTNVMPAVCTKANMRITYKKLVQRAGITKAELARRLHMSPNAVCAWDYPPGYAEAYLLLLIEYNKVRP